MIPVINQWTLHDLPTNLFLPCDKTQVANLGKHQHAENRHPFCAPYWCSSQSCPRTYRCPKVQSESQKISSTIFFKVNEDDNNDDDLLNVNEDDDHALEDSDDDDANESKFFNSLWIRTCVMRATVSLTPQQNQIISSPGFAMASVLPQLEIEIPFLSSKISLDFDQFH